ncbi:MAG: ribonuclease HI family protein [Methanolinea sp.]
MTRGKTLACYTDGASRGNPGPAAAAYLVVDGEGGVVESHSTFLGVKTNNEAEYHAVIAALSAAGKHGAGNVRVYSDSALVVRQLRGEYRVHEPRLRALHAEVRLLERPFAEVEYVHVARDNPWIRLADRMCNETLDGVPPRGK